MEKQIVVARLFGVRPGSFNKGSWRTVLLSSPRQLWELGRHIKNTMRIFFSYAEDSQLGCRPWPGVCPGSFSLLTVSVSLYSFHRWNIKSPHTVVLWESWNNTYSNRTVIREKHITNQIPFPDVKCHKDPPLHSPYLAERREFLRPFYFAACTHVPRYGYQRGLSSEQAINASCDCIAEAPHWAERCMTLTEMAGVPAWLMVESGVILGQTF